MRQFGVNRSTVREGIRVLEQGGLVRREASRKLFVCEPRPAALSTRISRALVLQDVTFRELFDTAMVLEVGSVEGAVVHADAEMLAALEENQERLESAVNNPVVIAELDSNFTRSSPAPVATACSKWRANPLLCCSFRPRR